MSANDRMHVIALERVIGMLTDQQIAEQIEAIGAAQRKYEALPADDPMKNWADPERIGASDLLLDYLFEEQHHRQELREWEQFMAEEADGAV